jgi:hypothetical protein
MPSALAVLKLTMRSNFVGAGGRPFTHEDSPYHDHERRRRARPNHVEPRNRAEVMQRIAVPMKGSAAWCHRPC